MNKFSILWFVILLVLIAIFTALGPAETTLGTNARVVYLHGAWVWAALAAFIAAGVVGLMGLIGRGLSKETLSLNQWSRALGRTGLCFWITYLPISLWAMQTNWNGLFLAEPRWRVAAIFAIAGFLLQLGLSILPVSWASFWNLAYVITLFVVLQTTEKVMHPPNPMLESSAWRIQTFFGGLTILLILAAWQMTRFFHAFERYSVQRSNLPQ
jgi:hypothetical protein